MTAAVAKTVISPRQGFAMCEGKKFLLARKNALINTRTGERVINGIFEDATETSPGYFPMVLLHIDKDWKRGGEAKWYEPNGEYDYFMREQVGFLTPHMGYTGGRCHDE